MQGNDTRISKNKKSFRKRENLDIDTLELEARAAGLGARDLGSRAQRQAKEIIEEQEKYDQAAKRIHAFKSAYLKADEACKALRPTDNPIFEQSNKLVFTEIKSFLWGLQPDDEETYNPDPETVVFGGSSSSSADEEPPKTVTVEKDEVAHVVEPDGMFHEIAVGKGLSSALHLLRDRGDLKVIDSDKEGGGGVCIERKDKFGRNLTPKDAFKEFSHVFHGKELGKRKQEKRIRQYQKELEVKQIKKFRHM